MPIRTYYMHRSARSLPHVRELYIVAYFDPNVPYLRTAPVVGSTLWVMYGGTVAPASFNILEEVGTCYRISYAGNVMYFPKSQCKPAVADPGFSDAMATTVNGFIRGWYANVYWRVIGAAPNQFVVGGIPSSPYLFSTQGLAQGYPNTRIIANVDGYGAMFCRGVGTDAVDPDMACVLHATNGSIIDPMFLLGSIGKWSKYNFSSRQIMFLRPSRTWDGTVADAGYADGSWQSETFIRGFYGPVYWRVVGDPPNQFISGGVPSNPYLYNARKNMDLGYQGMRQMASIQGYGVMYCRGVGDGGNPTLSCIQFDYFGEVVNIYAFINLGLRWYAFPH
ncbi:hypothetical protein HDU67_006352 [Dinochytrium kinnereticum]|nr:hypothetical protein HDU67_006352 [Dinochytrium kinnereticum]